MGNVQFNSVQFLRKVAELDEYSGMPANAKRLRKVADELDCLIKGLAKHAKNLRLRVECAPGGCWSGLPWCYLCGSLAAGDDRPLTVSNIQHMDDCLVTLAAEAARGE